MVEHQREINKIPSIERAALILAMTETRDKEKKLRHHYVERYGFSCVVTEVGGIVTTLQNTGKLVNSVLAAAINGKVIENIPEQINALLHATSNACKCVCMDSTHNASLALKISVISDGRWVAVAIFGKLSQHHMTEHLRVGMGYMHL
ncbi:nitrogen fixation protein [Heliorestis acidaminivorans]|uniref:Hut operon positive regulatory protein n=1 Tax=Heliorestis acidaminivorans TaxID=553427 RepID=A0A6I0F666_9FIRM|nr:HutP family protein [Heliorestis acidaminivorans]KAB2952882.1 nitrogen fixation protein [Heliorestis acidaminivorans]